MRVQELTLSLNVRLRNFDFNLVAMGKDQQLTRISLLLE